MNDVDSVWFIGPARQKGLPRRVYGELGALCYSGVGKVNGVRMFVLWGSLIR